MIYLVSHASGTRVGINPNYGAMLHEFSILQGQDRLNVIDSYETEEERKKDLLLSYKSAKLSPFVCRIDQAGYTHEGKYYQFERKFKDGSAIHGLLSHREFAVIDSFVTETTASAAFRYEYKSEDQGYPFHYSCIIRYSLHPQNRLDIDTTVENYGTEPIPLADGWHPYFKLGDFADDWQLKFRSSQKLVFNDQLIPTGEIQEDRQFLDGRSLRGLMLDNCFLLDRNENGSPDCILSNPANGLELRITADAGYPFLQVYIPEHRGSIALENLSGAPDCFNNKMGLMLLEKKQDFKTRFELRASKIG